ncbi:hypothetical protein EG68_07632 [Paragonimus skrjabini miyazakii]|uniref:Uncharacterized protein n=1 Tax=Paragonimus skrjabini miyazakii TaxID=59628 RepID=A0A8S9YMR3_9TREM|nr:hypothetical protein EG68_07632 [Paragonimus skrjabini miyazakii]
MFWSYPRSSYATGSRIRTDRWGGWQSTSQSAHHVATESFDQWRSSSFTLALRSVRTFCGQP